MSCRVLVFLLLSFVVIAECRSSSSLLSEQTSEPELLIFVSFGMPKQSLKLWAEQAKRANGTLLLRGFFGNSLEKTTAKTEAIFGQEPDVEIAIDPERFQQFAIKAVPAVVIVQPERGLRANDSVPQFDVVYGDTSIEDALQRIVNAGSPEGQKAAQHFLKHYRSYHE